MQAGEYQIVKLDKTDDEAIGELAKQNNGNNKLGKRFIDWWYRKNPTGFFTFVKLTNGTSTEGYATTNNFLFRIGNEIRKVAMPQNVLTSEKVRGGGFFGKLYRETERLNVENGYDTFLTFTNDMSTPIFLNKFSYLKGKCPDTIVLPNSMLSAFGKKNFRRIKEVPAEAADNKYSFSNSLIKEAAYYSWRYSNYPEGIIHILEIGNGKEVVGYAFLKKEQKKRIPFFIVMDILVTSQSSPVSESVEEIIKACRKYCSRKGYFFLLFLSLEGFKVRFFPLFRLKDRFNFLVKGRNPEDSQTLAATRFNIFFSDMDIV